jgi:hypothetical protein
MRQGQPNYDTAITQRGLLTQEIGDGCGLTWVHGSADTTGLRR